MLHQEKRRKLGKKDGSDERESILECPVCLETSLPPLYQCSNGHLICSACRTKVRECPTCRGCLGGEEGIRCLALEKLAQTLHWACRYKDKGCQEVRAYLEKKKHEDECKYRPFKCMCCEWEGENLQEHLTSEHKVQQHVASTRMTTHCIQIGDNEVTTADRTWKLLFNWSNSNPSSSSSSSSLSSSPSDSQCWFLLTVHHSKLCNPKSYQFALFHIGDRRVPYLIEVKGGGRTFSFQGPTRSVRESDTVFKGFDCLLIPSNIVGFVAKNQNQGEGILRINITLNY